MKETKFRVFAKFSLGKPINKYVYSDEFKHVKNPDLILYYFFRYLVDLEILHDGLEPYTGCKDKNNIEVYEGDIIKTNYHKDYFGHKDKFLIVKFESGRFVKTSENTFLTGISCFLDEVMGNIYENPELLELCK